VISYDAYLMLCEVARESISQPWAYVYLTGMWEHVARVGNVGLLSYRLISFNGDYLKTKFGRSKTKQEGQESKVERAFFHNPSSPGSNFLAALAFHVLMSDRQTVDTPEKLVFGATGVSVKAFEEWLKHVKICLTEEQLAILAVPVEDVGLHGLRKGALTFGSNAIDGPPKAGMEIASSYSRGM